MAGPPNPLHEPKETAHYGLGGPQPDNQILHGQFGRLMQFDQLFELVGKWHRIIRRQILQPEEPFRSFLLLGSEE